MHDSAAVLQFWVKFMVQSHTSARCVSHFVEYSYHALKQFTVASPSKFCS